MDGGRSVYLLRRMYCYECHIMHTELPDFLLKFKHFGVQIIEDTIDGYITPEDCYEAPSEVIMLRWQAWCLLPSALPLILSYVRFALFWKKSLKPQGRDFPSWRVQETMQQLADHSFFWYGIKEEFYY